MIKLLKMVFKTMNLNEIFMGWIGSHVCVV
jgi:hypothetical protein